MLAAVRHGGRLLSPVTTQVRWKRGKRKRRPKQGDQPPEQLANKGPPAIRLEDRIDAGAETPLSIAKHIRQHVGKKVADEKTTFTYRRKKDYNIRTNYRLLRAAGLTHDFPFGRPPELTPLEQLQRSALLPRTTNHERFSFPHTLDYKVYWGPPSAQEEPNKWEGSMARAQATFRIADLGLTTPQKERMVNITRERYHAATDAVCLEADSFPDRNHNCALLGDMLQALVEEAKKTDED
eukprot:GEMP01099435.1.p1 GENE.GEMP01099435.1~~GEMP01099435.1.p1  ORF type:complete len:238 (+),score=48.69 GEMP01099435.1:46-759(+)